MSAVQPLLEMINIEKSFNGVRVLKNVDLTVERGEYLAIMGPSGSGKTMLLRLILGLEKPDSGSVNLLGDYKYANVNAGVVFQEDRLCEQFSAVENVAMVNERLSETVAAEELSRFLPQDRQTVPVCELNETERRLVVMIRACIIPSDILLLDEPTSNVDSINEGIILQALQAQKQKKSISDAQKEALANEVIGYTLQKWGIRD